MCSDHCDVCSQIRLVVMGVEIGFIQLKFSRFLSILLVGLQRLIIIITVLILLFALLFIIIILILNNH